MIKWYFAMVFILVASTSQGAILFSDDFDGYADSPANHGWSMGSAVSVVSSGCRSGRCIKIHYTVEDTAPYQFQRSISTPEIWIRFYFKLSNHANPGGGGFKFLKLFGNRSGDNYANTTVGHPDYTNGVMYGIFAGDASTITNDASAIYRFDGDLTYSGVPGSPRVTTHLGPYNMPGNQDVWHLFEAHVKFNTDGNSDGEYQVWIDSTDWYHVTGVKNRNNSNVRNFVTLSLGDYERGGSFDIYYDDVAYGDSYIGPIKNSGIKIPNSPIIFPVQ